MNRNSPIFLSPPHYAENELPYIANAFAQSRWASGGENVDAFEESLNTYLQHGYAAALSSGTAAIHLALLMLDVQPGDEVICQSFTFSASANPIAYVGAQPVFVDSENETWNLCPHALEEAIIAGIARNKKPKAIILVHLYGMPAQLDDILEISRNYGIPLIEDAAEALGSAYKGRQCGTFGTYGIISFNGNKIITTAGGGALICQSAEQQKRAVFLATQARDPAPHYQHSEIGYNYMMSNISAGIGRAQMEVLGERIAARRRNHDFYAEFFKRIEGVKVFSEHSSDYFSNHWLSAITVEEKTAGFSREDLRLKLLEDNIESRPLWKPMHLQPVFADAPYYGGSVCEDLFNKGLCLPSGSNLTSEDLARIQSAIFSLVSDKGNFI